MNNNQMPVLTEEQRAELIEALTSRIEIFESKKAKGIEIGEMRLLSDKITLAALTAEPQYQMSKRPGIWIDVDQNEADNNQIHGYKSRVVYAAPAPIPFPRRQDNGIGELWDDGYNAALDDVEERIKAAGGRVEGE